MKNAWAFGIFLALAHGSDVEFPCSPDSLLNIVEYSKEHQLEALIALKVHDWIKTAELTGPFHSNTREYNEDWKWLKLSYELGQKQKFHRASYRLAFLVPYYASEDVMRTTEENIPNIYGKQMFKPRIYELIMLTVYPRAD